MAPTPLPLTVRTTQTTAEPLWVWFEVTMALDEPKPKASVAVAASEMVGVAPVESTRYAFRLPWLGFPRDDEPPVAVGR